MLEPIFGFLTGYAPVVSVLIFSVMVLFIINIFYRILIKQNDAKLIKQRSKEINAQLKEAQKSGDTARQKKLMSDMFTENNKLMRLTMKPMMVSLIIVVIFLPTMSTFYGDSQVQLVNGTGTASLRGVNHTVTVTDDLPALGNAVPYVAMSSIQPGCDSQCFVAHEGGRYELTYEKGGVRIAPIVASLPFALPLIGYTLGWLGWYILVSIPVMAVMRRAMKIYI